MTELETELLAALEALAKVQYDGTVEGLRYQIEHEDWGDVLDPVETTAAYELTLAVIAKTQRDSTSVGPDPRDSSIDVVREQRK